jgi:hypothetical protein
MGLGEIFIISIVLFTIIYFAVRLAINPLLRRQGEIVTNTDTQNFELVKLRDMGILSDAELEWAIKRYRRKNDRNEGYEQYQKYAEILNKLKEMGNFTDERYCNRIDKLKKYFKVE